MQESKNFCSNYPTKFSITLDGIWQFVDELHSHLFLIHSMFSFKGEKPTYVILFQFLAFACVRTFSIYRPISIKLGLMIGTTKLCILILV